MKVFRTERGVVAKHDGRIAAIPEAVLTWDAIFRAADPRAVVAEAIASAASDAVAFDEGRALAPTLHQEVWAAGVTYYRSRDARMDESHAAGGSDFYAMVYDAERPELFFKATPQRVSGPGQPVRLRRDARWTVPEPELVLAVNAAGRVFGYTIGNDMSSRDIEGENPLYLPQAKIYDGSCAAGPCLWLPASAPEPDTGIALNILRAGRSAFSGETTLAKLKRTPESLVAYLYRETAFPDGVLLFTGTGIVPPNDFTLAPGDEIRIAIGGIGELVNTVAEH